ncbi:DUF350 domain-containing protein [Gordonia sp. CPCC 205333]|uniref:DUF350 domain-containing protein n=1 Tax=Gordonia sp. CPCC 205333 TaxID=3140790 RepID=UPI003AF39439
MVEMLRDNMASSASYGLIAVVALVAAFGALDLVTPGSLRKLVWIDHNRNAVILTVAQVIAVAQILTASIMAGTGLELWRSILFTLVYVLIGIAVLAFSFVLIDWLTPGKLGSLVLDGNTPTVWINAAVFVGIGAVMAAALTF